MELQVKNSNDKPIHALVTGVGAIIGYGIIKSLRQSGLPIYIVGMDIYEDAVGQHWCDKFIQAKYAIDPNYIDFLKNVIQDNQIDIVFFGTEQEIYRVDSARDELAEDLSKLILNQSELLALAKDKWKTCIFLQQHGLGKITIPSVIVGNYEDISKQYGKTFLLKPRHSYASKGIEIVSNAEEFDFYKQRMGDNFMAQKLVGDLQHEYTIGIFGLGDGSYSGKISMRRQLSQEGATAKAWVIEDPLLDDTVDQLCQVFCPLGPTNLQFRLDAGQYLLLEINPRISSSTSLRMAFGYNEALLSIEYFLNKKIIVPKVYTGRAARFIDEVVIIQ